MDTRMLDEYQKWAMDVEKILEKDRSWVDRYKKYSDNMIENSNAFIEARRKFRVYKPLHAYLTIGKAKDKKIVFDLRYLGQSVGSIKIKGEEVLLSVDRDQSKNNKEYFKCMIGELKDVDWKKSKEAKKFRKYFRDHAQGLPRQIEHMVESALFSETGKTQSTNKMLCNITPVAYANTRIHMKTTLAASDAKNNKISISNNGGEIDLLCRRSIKSGRGESRLVVIEIKDENDKGESFDLAMKQAISYAVFIKELIYSEAGDNWMKLWGMKNQKKSGFIIDCAVAMPKGITKPGYGKDRIELINREGNKDYIELHYLELIDITSENVKFDHSFL